MPKLAPLLLLGSALSAASAPLRAQHQTTVADAVKALNAAAPSPARIALATRVAGRLMPDGTYRRMMSGTMDQMMGAMVGQMGDLPLRDLAAMGGVSTEQLKGVGPGSLKQIMAILDPAYEERIKRTMKVTTDTMVEVIATYEPRIREGLAEAYAARFNDKQLADLDRFLATPSGIAYAHEAVAIMADPAVMRSMQAMLPGLMKVLPTLGPKIEAATADLPKRRKPADLSPDECKRLAELMGVDPAKLAPIQVPAVPSSAPPSSSK